MVVMIFSTFLYIVSNHKSLVHVDKFLEEKFVSCDDEEEEESNSNQFETVASTDEPLQNEALEKFNIDDVSDYTTVSQDLVSESENKDHQSTSETSEVDWRFGFRYDLDHNQSIDYSDGSISDEESLIEIELLPSGHYVDGKNFFSEQSVMELLSEFNEVSEEENFIEIDISMGSIKYSRFEIKA